MALVPFRVWIPVNFAGVEGGYNSDCGVPAVTSFRKLEPDWKAYSHGYMAEPDYLPSSRADLRCQTPARRRLLGGSAAVLIGLLILIRALRQRTFASSMMSATEPLSTQEHEPNTPH